MKPFLRYLNARLDANAREHEYRRYVTNSLQAAPQGKYLRMSWEDIINDVQIEEPTAEEIIDDVVTRIGLTIME